MKSKDSLAISDAVRGSLLRARSGTLDSVGQWKLANVSKIFKSLRSLIPSGGALPKEVWLQRHRFLVGLTWFHAIIIALLGPLLGYTWEFSFSALTKDGTIPHALLESFIIALFATVANWRRIGPTLQSVFVALGLTSASAIFVHLSGGYIELHFHFFVMIVFLAFYQEWIPFGVAITYVALHHGIVGVLWPEKVYNHAAAFESPWTWAGIHAFFVLWASAGSVIAWRYNEKAYALAAKSAKETELALERIRALYEINVAVTSTLDLSATSNILAERIKNLLPYSAVQIWLANNETGVLERAACWNLDEAEWKRRELSDTPPLIKEAMLSKRPVVAQNIQTDPRTLDREFYRRQRFVSYIGAPLLVGGEVLGVLACLTKEERHFAADEIQFLSAVGSQAAVAIHNSQLYEQTRKQAVELEKTNKDLKSKQEIQALLKALNEDVMRLDIDGLFKKLTGKIREILAVDISDVRVLVDGQWQLTGIAGIDPHLLTSGRSGTGRGPAGWIQQHRQPLAIRDLAHTDLPTGTTMKNVGVRGYVGVPLFSRGGEVIGVLRALTYQPRDFTQEEIDLLQQLANGSGIALENAGLLEEIKHHGVALKKSNESKDELLKIMARQKEELSHLNAGLETEIAERGRARAEIAAKNRDLETLLYVTSHDLREPLRAIENFSRIVHDRYKDGLDEKGQDFLRRVIQGAQRLNRLLDDILALSRSQRIGPAAEVVDGEVIVHEAVKRLDAKINATHAQVRVANNFDGLRADRMWATQAIYNLLANALKFTRDGEPPEVEIEPYRPNGSDSNVAGITVRDRGPGVSKEHAERIFQLFQRAVGREVEGTGAGLAIVRQIAERHGGNAWVEQREGGGSEFIITFSRS